MGCHNSKPKPVVDHGGTLHVVFERAIATHPSPTSEHHKLLQENSVEGLRHPEGEPERSLLVLALKKNKLAWFRPLLDKCNPHVTWTEAGRPTSIRDLLQGEGDARYEWKAAKAKWDLALQSKETKISAEPIVKWGTLFPLAAKAFGAVAVTAVNIVANVSGFTAGMSICVEICKAFTAWTSTSTDFNASNEVARKMKDALQATLDLEDERIANAQFSTSKTYKKNVESNAELLRILLDGQSERMRKELLKRSTTQSHKDTMMEDMLMEVLDRQAKVMKAYTNEKMLYRLNSLSSKLPPMGGANGGVPTPSTAAGSMGDEDGKDEEPDENEEDDSEDSEDGDEDCNSAYSWGGFGGQESS